VAQKYQERFKMPEVKTVKGLYDLYLAKGIQLDTELNKLLNHRHCLLLNLQQDRNREAHLAPLARDGSFNAGSDLKPLRVEIKKTEVSLENTDKKIIEEALKMGFKLSIGARALRGLYKG
jgi:hypothetical protein